LARALAEFLFDDERAMIRIDMSEYQERHTVSRLIGAPPGYVGYEEGGQLTEAVRRRPYSVVLLDEIEKAHQDAFNVLLQLLDDRKLAVTLTPAAREYLAVKGYDPAYGARPLKRLIQKELQDALALKLLSGEIREGDTVEVDHGAEGLEFRRLEHVPATP